MTFADLPAGAAVFVDANTLVYRFSLHPQFGPLCVDLLERIERRELAGYTSTHVVSEAAHRLMTLEAITLLHRPAGNIGNWLRTNPGEVQKLASFRQAVERIVQSNLQVLAAPPALLVTGAAVCQQIGLLTNDGLLVAVMKANNQTNLASGDADFDRVPGPVCISGCVVSAIRLADGPMSERHGDILFIICFIPTVYVFITMPGWVRIFRGRRKNARQARRDPDRVEGPASREE
jgi:predicted nucleic acid-binding protein